MFAAWWLDTLVDVFVVVLVCIKVYQIHKAPEPAPARVRI
jgi:hypothetical protein